MTQKGILRYKHNMELVSIIIPTYKGANYLSRAIDSVLMQSYENMQIIVIDDNAPDSEARFETEAVMEQYSADPCVLYIKHAYNMNGSAARNTGIAAATGTYITFLDDDDYYLSGRIERCANFLNENPEYGGVYVGVDLINANNDETILIRPEKDLSVNDLLLDLKAIGTGSNIFLRKDVIWKVKGFDTDFLRRQDIEFMIRVCEQCRVGFISDLMIIKSINGTSNVPNYLKMKENVERFSSKFKKEIMNLGEDKVKYYDIQYRDLFYIALSENNKNEIKEAKAMLAKYGIYSVKDRFLAFMYISGLRKNSFVSKIFSKKRILRKHMETSRNSLEER